MLIIYKKKVKKELSKITGEIGSAKAALDYTLERLEDFNIWAEMYQGLRYI